MTLTVLVDTSERKPWNFPPSIPIERVSLIWGDYAPKGSQDRFAIERKSLRDLTGSIFGDWTRFDKELTALSGYDLACIVVEASEDAVRRAEYRYPDKHPMRVGPREAWAKRLDRLEPKIVLKAAAQLHARYGVPVLFKPGRVAAATYALQMMQAYVASRAA